jgi:hypothetical protein
VLHWPTILSLPSEKLPRPLSTHARNLHCSPAAEHGRRAFSHSFFTASVVAASQVARWKAATSSRHLARTQDPALQLDLGSLLQTAPGSFATSDDLQASGSRAQSMLDSVHAQTKASVPVPRSAQSASALQSFSSPSSPAPQGEPARM